MPRLLPLLCVLTFALATAGCNVPIMEPVGAYVAADAASVAVFGRGIEDIVVSGLSGRDCSVVRLEQHKTYCVPVPPPPATPEFCTHELGGVDCWVNPWALNDDPRPLADQATPTKAQDAYRTARWPKSLTAPTD